MRTYTATITVQGSNEEQVKKLVKLLTDNPKIESFTECGGLWNKVVIDTDLDLVK